MSISANDISAVNSPPLHDKPNYTPGHVLHGHEKAISSIKFSPDGSRIASSGDENIIKIWSLTTGTLERNVEVDSGPVSAIAWSGDSVHLAVASPSQAISRIKIFNVLTGNPDVDLTAAEKMDILCLNYSHASDLLLSGDFVGDVRIWGISGDTQYCRLIHAHLGAVKSAQFNKDATRIVTCSADGHVRIWNTANSQCMKDFADSDLEPCTHAQFSSNGKYILLTSPEFIRVVDHKTAQCLKTYLGEEGCQLSSHAEYIGDETSVKWVVGGAGDRIYIWGLQSRQIVQIIKGTDTVVTIAVHPNKGVIATASDRTITLWEDQA